MHGTEQNTYTLQQKELATQEPQDVGGGGANKGQRLIQKKRERERETFLEWIPLF